MPFCYNCGKEYKNYHKFCTKCGASLFEDNEQEETLPKAEKNYRSKRSRKNKCPFCNADRKAFQLMCDHCGLEFTDVEKSDAVKDFETSMYSIMNSRGTNLSRSKKQASYISSFTIPNTKEDLFGFASLAYGNATEEDVYLSDICPSYMDKAEFSAKRELVLAWYSLLKQICVRIEQVPDSEEEQRWIKLKIEEIDAKKQKAKLEVEKNNQKANIEKRKNKKYDAKLKWKNSKEYLEDKSFAKSMILIFLGFLALMAIFASPYIINKIKTYNEKEEFSRIYSEAINDINNHNYDDAYNKAIQLNANQDDNKKEWDKKRQDLLNSISREKMNYEASKYVSSGKMINPPDDSDDLEGEDYNDVVKQFTEAGFLFVSTQTTPKGWFDDEGEVESVSINGKTDFDDDDEFPEEATVIITYYTKE